MRVCKMYGMKVSPETPKRAVRGMVRVRREDVSACREDRKEQQIRSECYLDDLIQRHNAKPARLAESFYQRYGVNL